MKRVLCLFPFVSMVALSVACGGSDATDDDDDQGGSSGATSSSSGAPTTSSSGGSSSSSGGSSSSSGGSSGVVPFACEDTPFVFPVDASPALAAATYEDYLEVSEDFPFDVVGFYTTTIDIEPGGAGWGEHGGLFTTDPTETGDIDVHRLTAPSGATGALLDDMITLPKPVDLFEGASANYPPVASLPNDQYVLSYTTAGPDGTFPGLAYLFDGVTQKSRGFANGFFAAAGTVRGDSTRVFYHALSPLEPAQADGDASALYAVDAVGQQLAGDAVTSFPLIATTGENSGPIVKDGNGSLFVATQGTEVNVRAVSRCGALEATTTLDVAALRSYDTAGTAALAVIPATATQPGYVVTLSYSPATFATAFTRSGNVFSATGEDLVDPFVLGSGGNAISFYNDDKGFLWVAVATDEDGTKVLKLRRRPAT